MATDAAAPPGPEPAAPAAEAEPAVLVEAKALITRGNPAAAVPLIEGYLAGHPDDGLGWRRLASALSQAGRDEDALAAAERAIALDPDDARPHVVLATVHLSRRRLVSASVALCAARERRDAPAELHSLLAQMLLLVPGRYADALDEARRAVNLVPRSPVAGTVLRSVRRAGWGRVLCGVLTAAWALGAVLMVCWGMFGVITGGGLGVRIYRDVALAGFLAPLPLWLPLMLVARRAVATGSVQIDEMAIEASAVLCGVLMAVGGAPPAFWVAGPVATALVGLLLVSSFRGRMRDRLPPVVVEPPSLPSWVHADRPTG